MASQEAAVDSQAAAVDSRAAAASQAVDQLLYKSTFMV